MAAPSLTLVHTQVPVSTPFFERVVAGLALVMLTPALGAVLAAVRVLSGKAPLVAHLRVGQFGEPLWVWKVRTMWSGREERTGGCFEHLGDTKVPALKAGNDPRVTSSFAAFCRRHSIDEIPQLWHVVSGTMRIVGPRPMTQVELDEHYGSAQTEVLSVPPGLTGLWQVMGRNRLSYAQRRRLDVFLARRYGWRLCLRVLLRTVREILRPRDAW